MVESANELQPPCSCSLCLWLQPRLERVEASVWFNGLTAVVIAVNTVMLCISVESMRQGEAISFAASPLTSESARPQSRGILCPGQRRRMKDARPTGSLLAHPHWHMCKLFPSTAKPGCLTRSPALRIAL